MSSARPPDQPRRIRVKNHSEAAEDHQDVIYLTTRDETLIVQMQRAPVTEGGRPRYVEHLYAPGQWTEAFDLEEKTT